MVRIKIIREDIYEFDVDDIPLTVNVKVAEGQLHIQEFEGHPYVVDRWGTGLKHIGDTHKGEIHMIGTEVIDK